MGVFDYGRAAYRRRVNIILLHGQVMEASQQTTRYFLAMNILSLKSLDTIPWSYALASVVLKISSLNPKFF
jgi:hypothetical protein